MNNGIHFVFQHLRNVGREKLFSKCFASWIPTFISEDSIVIVESNLSCGLPKLFITDKDNIKVISCNDPLLACQKRNIGISISDKKYTFLIDDDMELIEHNWREKCIEASAELKPGKDAFFSLAPKVKHRYHGIVNIKGTEWYTMKRMGFNCVLAKTAIWKAIPHINWAMSADKTYLDFIHHLTSIGLYRSTMTNHTAPTIKGTRGRKARAEKVSKHLWMNDMVKGVRDMKNILINEVRL